MINKQERMSFNGDCSSALHLLEHIQQTINGTDDVQLQMQTAEDINMLISVFSNPILRSIVTVEDSLAELNQQLQQHPSILPVDLYVTPSGELSLNVVPPDEMYDSQYDGKYLARQEFDDQTVPVVKLSNSSSTDTSASPQLGTPGTANGTLPPITTQTYAIEFQKAIEESSRGRDIINVQLYKPEGSSLGFSVVGLRSEEKGELGIFIQDIQNTGVAGRDGNLREGDQILAIDGQPLDSNISHHQAISILQKARGLVELVVARGAEEEAQQIPSPVVRSPSAVSDSSKAGSDMVLNTEWSQVEVIDLVNDGSGLGFGIIGGRSTGVVVKTILPGGVADRDGRLQSGDHILQIGDVNLRGMGSEQVAAVLRQSGSHVRLVVARPVEPTSPDYQALGSHAPIVPTKILGDPEELDRHLLQNGYTEALARQTPVFDAYNENLIYREHQDDIELHPQATLVMDAVRNPVGPSLPLISAPSLSVLTMDMLPLETTDLPEMEKFNVELKKDLHGLGITIAGYVCEKEELSGIFVKSISEGSAADVCKKIQVNDRIVEVDGRSLQGYTNHQAVEVLRSTGQIVKLCLERYLRGPKFEQLQQAIAASELKLPTPTSSTSSLPRLPIQTDNEPLRDFNAKRESYGNVESPTIENVEATNLNVDISDLEMLIDDDYEGPLKPTVEAAIQAKWNKILGNDSEIIVAQLCKLSEGGGLGISLEGTVDVEHGQEVRPHHYIRSILPEGPVGRNGRLRSGDELLEVNGYRLLGMNHIEVVSILKDLSMSVRMVCARRSDNILPHKLLERSQDKAFAPRNILGGSLQNLIPVTDRLVKAKSDGSLASTTITATATDGSFSKMKSRSLEPLTGLAMWSSEPQIIQLVKGERGLGFSILDYQDPMNPNETVIVIRSLVPGGVAQLDGQLIPGDRLVFVNDTNLENASLDQAVQALKGAPKGLVRIGVAKPLPIPDSVSHCQKDTVNGSQASPTIDDRSMFSSCESLSLQLKDEAFEEKKLSENKPMEKERKKVRKKSERIGESIDDLKLEASETHLPAGLSNASREMEKTVDDDLSTDLLQLMVPVATEKPGDRRTSSLGDTTDDDLDEEEFQTAWAADVIHLPPSLEVEIRVHKGTEPLGISVDSVDRGVNGMLVVLVVPGGAVARDGHIHPGDYLVSVNHETLRKVTNSQARAILRRAQLLSTDISVTYIPEEAAVAYRKSIRQDSHSSVESSPVAVIRHTSPRSPYIPSDSSLESSDERDKELHSALATPEGLNKQDQLRDSPKARIWNDEESFKGSKTTSPGGSITKERKLGLSQAHSLKTDITPTTEFASERLNREFCASSTRKLSQTKSADGEMKQGPLSICVVDGLYSVHSPKGNKILVGIEMSRKDKFQSDVQKLREKVPSFGGPSSKKDGKSENANEVREKGNLPKMKELMGGSEEVKISVNSSSFQKLPLRGNSLDVKTHNEFLGVKVKQNATDTFDATCTSEQSVEIREGVVIRNTKLADGATKFAESVLRESVNSAKNIQKTKMPVGQMSLDERCISPHKPSGKNEVEEAGKTLESETKGTKGNCNDNDSEINAVLPTTDIHELKGKRNLIQTRVPSFECTCEGGLDDASPEQMCTCASPPGPLDTLDVYSDNSKKSSRYHSAEVLAAHSLDVANSNQTSQDMTVNQEMANTESLFSSGDEFKSGTTSPFYSPRGDSPEPSAQSKYSNKMDKEVSANILLAKHWGEERRVEVVREPNCSLGISIVGGKVDLYNAGPDSSSAILGIFIKNVLPNSPAGLTRELKTGDRILEVDSIDLRNASHERAVEVIRGAGSRVRFLVQSLIQWNIEGSTEGPVLPSSSPPPPPLPTELEISKRGSSSPSLKMRTPEPAVVQQSVHDTNKQLLQEARRSSDFALDSDSDILEIVLPLDVDIDVDEKEGAAVDEDEDGEDEDVADDRDEDNDNEDDDDDDDDEVVSDVVDDPEDHDEEDLDLVDVFEQSERTEEMEVAEDIDEKCDTEGKLLAAEGAETCGKSSSIVTGQERRGANLDEPDEFGYTLSKVKKKYESLGDSVLIVNLEKSHRGLGISLAGHKDRNRMAVFVCGINPNGAAFKTGGIEVGDEILEVNGIVLRGRCHLNASAIIKGLPGPIFKVIILRRASALQDLAVKPITQFPVTLDDEPPEQKYAKFRGLKTVTIKKGNQNLGIMIIEGKHAEVGQGIFISDIQPGSSAEQAGLTIGDMILAVNKDTLLGTNYDTAASLLKKTEGLVTLVVCNPNKAREEVRTGMGTLETKGSTPSVSPTSAAKESSEKSRLISFSGLKSKPSTSPSKQLLEIGGSPLSNESRSGNSMLTVTSPFMPTGTLTPKTSPALSLRKSSSGKLADDQAPDPASCPIVPGKEVAIEINKEKLGLGLSVIGGCDTAMGVTIIHEIFSESAAAKDGRLQPGDQIVEVNSEDLSKITHAKAQTLLRQAPAKVKMIVYRDENITKDDLLQVMNVELLKKPGKGLGLSVAAKKDGSQVFISEVVHGGVAEIDGRLMKGDYILEVNGISLKGTNQETAAAILKSCTGKVVIKTGRIRFKKYSNSSNGRNSLPSPVEDLNGLDVEVNGLEDPDTENALVNGCFRIKRTSSLRTFVRSFSIRKRHV